jgi:hypothetical protein
MAVVAFDLDETIGRFGNLDAFLFFLYPKSVYEGQMAGSEPFAPSELLQSKITAAVDRFADCLLAKEPGLGMLRPGILDIMKVLVDAKQRGDLKAAAIYSNNGNSGLLRLAKTVIESALNAPGFFCDLVCWYDPRRKAEIVRGKPGHAAKTYAMLKKIFLSPSCGVGSVAPQDVYFFDDLRHPDIFAEIGPENYLQVVAYKQDPPLPEILDCFLKTKETTDLFTDEEYYRYIAPILAIFKKPVDGGFDSVMKCLQDFYNLFQPDTDVLLARLAKRFEVSYGNNYFPVVNGGKRMRKSKKYRQKKAYHKKLTRKRGTA